MMQLFPDDLECLAWFKARYGIHSDSQVIRLALRLWRDMIMTGLMTDRTPQVQSVLRQSYDMHGKSGRRKGRRYTA
jgi:hypothetical protein